MVMPVIWLDRLIGFQPQALPIYLSMWVYVSLPPALLSTRRELVRLEAKYERIRNKSGKSADHETPSADGGTAARSRGSHGDGAGA